MSAAILVLWRRFICRACGLVYDEAAGDADSGLAAGTRFEDIPDDWACPICGVTKADFEPYDDAPVERRAAPERAARSVRRDADAGVVIVGAGRAGWTVAEALRERDADLPITIVSACDASVYDKPQLSVAFAKRLVPSALAREGGGAAAARLGVRLLTRTDAVRVLARERVLRTTRGPLPWRHLVLAHGAAPRELPQLPASLCWRLNHLDAYLRFRAALGEPDPDPRRGVLVAGAGLVGSELANDLALAGHRVTLLDVEARPLAALLSPADSARLLGAWQTLPLHFEGGTRIAGVERVEGGRLRVRCDDGRTFEAAHVVAATGLETPSRLAESAGLAWHGGIAVDPATLATNVAGIHALGDCIAIEGRALRFIEPIARQANVIADRIVGRVPKPYSTARPPTRIKTSSLPLSV